MRSNFTRRLSIEVPVLSANMDTITTAPMAIAMAWLGAIGVVHRFLSPRDQAEEVAAVKGHLGTTRWEPASIEPDKTVSDARQQAERLQLATLLVVAADSRLLGVVTSADLSAHEDEARLHDLMTPVEKLVTAPAALGLDEGRRRLRAHGLHELPLLDKDGRIAGLLTARDFELRDRLGGSTLDGHGRLAVAAAVGIRGDYLPRSEALLSAGADALVVDVANGHSDHVIAVVRELKAAWPEIELVAGNVVTGDGVRELVAAGADAVKVGIGSGHACTTTSVAGVGRPQLTAILECAKVGRELGIPIVADGGVRRPADVAKAIAAGASTVMVGSMLAGTAETPGEVKVRNGRPYKEYRGMASRTAVAARLALEGRTEDLSAYVPEGKELELPLRGLVAETITELSGGLRSAMSYSDSLTVPEFWEKSRLERLIPSPNQ
jgi:IMP dehydrogenase